jgi:hypothetical protein
MNWEESMKNGVSAISDLFFVREWDSDTFHRRVIELEASGYVARQETYCILPEMDPETGAVIHLHTIEMRRADPNEPE